MVRIRCAFWWRSDRWATAAVKCATRCHNLWSYSWKFPHPATASSYWRLVLSRPVHYFPLLRWTKLLISTRTKHCVSARYCSIYPPVIMGIINTTPDSFMMAGYIFRRMMRCGRRKNDPRRRHPRCGRMSTRPGAEIVDAETELGRVIPVIGGAHKKISRYACFHRHRFRKSSRRSHFPRRRYDQRCFRRCADPSILFTAARLGVLYVLMHVKGVPLTMQAAPHYDNVTRELVEFLFPRSRDLMQNGVREIVIDPGFGFGKSLEHNYQIAAEFDQITQIGWPVMVGVSRKAWSASCWKWIPTRPWTAPRRCMPYY